MAPHTNYVIGIDEVGRGALAGPVVVAAARLPRNFQFSTSHFLGKLKDSKKLSPERREAWYAHVVNHPKISFVVARVYPRVIERMNISAAANLAAARAFGRLIKRADSRTDSKSVGFAPGAGGGSVFLDGGLYLGNGGRKNGKRKKENGRRTRTRAKTVVRGDEKIHAIKAASIIAKVHRDRFMRKLAKKYPAYRFEQHKGYGTKVHRAAIRKFGPCPMHRLTFIKTGTKL